MSFGILASLLFSLFQLVGYPEPFPSSYQDTPPNILLILADDLGYGELGCYGQSQIETPHIDALARSGMRFTQFYSGSPVCAPSRCVLLTGKHTGHAYIRGNDEWKDRGEVWDFAKAVEDPLLEGQRPLPKGTQTLGSLLQAQGYATGLIGKWGLGAPLTEGIPNEQGFDFFYGYNCQRQAHTYYPKHLWKNREKVWLDNPLVVPGTKLNAGDSPADPASYQRFHLKEYAPELMLKEATQFIQASDGQPFFLYFASPIPHVPLQAPAKWVSYYQVKFGDEEPYLGDKGYFPNQTPRATYAAMVSYLDEQIGALIELLKESGKLENTLILFTSDNGPTYTGGSDSQFFDSAAPFTSEYGRGKGFVYEGGIRVPFIASWPGKIPPNTHSDQIGAFWDILPTLLSTTQGKIPAAIDGVNLLPSMKEKGSTIERPYLYWEFPSYQGQQAIREGKWKAIRKDLFKGNKSIELYDLEQDREELHDVATDFPEVVARMDSLMKAAHNPAAIERFKIKELGD
ncbi:MAG: arylsulfatase [Bacteroidota bacterium]